MAFVNRSPRNLNLSTSNAEIGPGQYLAIETSVKKISKAAFSSSSNRDLNSIKKDNSPGPGSYAPDDKFEKIAKEMEKSIKKEKSTSIYKQDFEYNVNLGGWDYVVSNKNKKAGFITKEKRFKVNPNKMDLPGPGSYLNNNSYSTHPSSLKDISSAGKAKSVRMINNSPNKRICSIPSKFQAFGYDIDENGEAILNDDPDKVYKYQGVKNDSVGPGVYDLIKTKGWVKPASDWSKSLAQKNPISILRASSDVGTISRSQEMNTLDDKLQSQILKIKIKEDKDKIFKQLKERRQKLLNTYTDAEKRENDLVERIVFHDQPGPGYYYHMFDEKKNKPKPEKFQLFGSGSQRFASNTTRDIGPGAYFTDDSKIDLKKVHGIKKK